MSRKGSMPMNTTGLLSQSIKNTGTKGILSEIDIQSNQYGSYLDKGIKNVPYTQGSRAGVSQYILGLQRWAMIKFGLNAKKALQMAFAIAKTQKIKGSAPDNPGWIEEIKGELDRQVARDLNELVFASIQMDVNKTLNITI